MSVEGVPLSDGLIDAAQRYVRARLAHVHIAREAIMRAIECSPESEDAAWADGEQIAQDRIKLTVRCELADGSTRWRKVLPSSVELERAERALVTLLEGDRDDTELRQAIVAVLEDRQEPFRGFDRNDVAQKAAADARLKRHVDVFQRLQELVARLDERRTS